MIKPSADFVKIFKDIDHNEGFQGQRPTLGLALKFLNQAQDVYLVSLFDMSEFIFNKNIGKGATLVSYKGGWDGRTELEKEIQALIQEYGEDYNFTEFYEGV